MLHSLYVLSTDLPLKLMVQVELSGSFSLPKGSDSSPHNGHVGMYYLYMLITSLIDQLLSHSHQWTQISSYQAAEVLPVDKW